MTRCIPPRWCETLGLWVLIFIESCWARANRRVGQSNTCSQIDLDWLDNVHAWRICWSLDVRWSRKDAKKYCIPFVVHSQMDGEKKTKLHHNITIMGMMTKHQ